MPIVVDHDERRHYIARVVERVIAKQGMDAVTIRNVAREAGFRWNEPVSGAWSRRLSEREAALLPFPVVPIDADQQRRSA